MERAGGRVGVFGVWLARFPTRRLADGVNLIWFCVRGGCPAGDSCVRRRKGAFTLRCNISFALLGLMQSNAPIGENLYRRQKRTAAARRKY